MPLTQGFNALLASAESPWPGTETKTLLVCRIPKKDEDRMMGANEFLDKDGRICRWVIVYKK
jgi:hypothetical protein